MKSGIAIFILLIVYFQLEAKILDVGVGHTYASIASAVNYVNPGDTILCHDASIVGGAYITGLHGTSAKWIYLLAEKDKEIIIQGGNNSIQLADAAFLHIEGFIIQGQTGNGMNLDDGGTFDTPAHHIRIVKCTFRDINATGNNDLLKLSGIEDFYIDQCTFLNGSAGGSGIDMVGCHRGIITRNRFTNLGSNSIQAKGGTSDLEISRNVFINGGARSLNLGGSTGLEFFRPQNATAEAERIQVIANVIQGSEAAIAYVGCRDVVVTNNTILYPEKWVLRILQETVDVDRFLPCGNNSFNNNIIVINQNVKTICNIGPYTAPTSFIFSNNLWHQVLNPNWQNPNLPGLVINQYFQDPMIINGSLYKIGVNSPAVSKGLPYPTAILDIEGKYFDSPPSIGAFEGQSSTSANTTPIPSDIFVYPNPTAERLTINFESFAKRDVYIYNMNGENVLYMQSNDQNIQVNLATLNAGNYLISVHEGVKKIQKTIIKQ